MTGPDLELEERLRKLGPSFKNASQPPATLHARVMASTTLPRSPSGFQNCTASRPRR